MADNLDGPSGRYGSTPHDGPAEGMAIAPHFEKMRRDYYRFMGWDARGRPLRKTLQELGLGNVAADLWGANG